MAGAASASSGQQDLQRSRYLKNALELGIALPIEREPVTDPEIHVQALEAIYLITLQPLQEAGRRAFWSINGPRILQVGYEDEEDPKVMEAYERAGSLLVQETGAAETSPDPTNADSKLLCLPHFCYVQGRNMQELECRFVAQSYLHLLGVKDMTYVWMSWVGE